MEKIRPLLIALLVVSSVGIVPQTVVADDQWPGLCEEAETIGPGTYSGTLSPEDFDTFLLDIDKGDSAKLRLSWEEDAGDQLIIRHTDKSIEEPPKTNYDEVYDDYAVFSESPERRVEEGETKVITIYSEGTVENRDSEPVCFTLAPYEYFFARTSNGAGAWEMSVSINENEPPELISKNKYINISKEVSELESLLEQKNQTISDLESRINELESQSTNSNSGDVNIQVTVNPANGQENFIEGGKALVHAESENADVSKMAVKYGGGTYQLNSSEEIAIPLADAGTQEMTLVYGDTMKQVSIDVQSQQEQTQEDSSPTTTGGDGPGFGIVAAVIALLGSAFLFGRYR